ncbi:MAG TPA: hypothetical protein VHM00_07870 [Caldimonas sp.]|jgi:hypothetical protein|nr:hypothetical protein [Caldimonas sp.]HEX2540986.1 hypothetical protein [Caldimonas sp.]
MQTRSAAETKASSPGVPETPSTFINDDKHCLREVPDVQDP